MSTRYARVIAGAILAASMASAHAEACKPVAQGHCREADLHGAKIQAANAPGANLRGAKLREATLKNTDLQGATLLGALWIDGHKCTAGKDKPGSCD